MTNQSPQTCVYNYGTYNDIHDNPNANIFTANPNAQNALPRPKENDYNAVREYIEKRKVIDPVFKIYCKNNTRKQVCEFLSIEFGWTVEPHQLGVNIGRNQ